MACAADARAEYERLMRMHAEIMAALQQHDVEGAAILAQLDEVAGIVPAQAPQV